ncbi:EF hand domain-containing protein [Tahibacter aquaticus]|jgi:hypothetical protein|uniref:EF hand domain-containing protein n=1 Tax=Tahibacter aquaticus TaxID=520092 RepID=A0A4R6Z0K3_9GAMM|nr:hypothetical protein [Tahibacter aquaticus]TDR45060.1 EF hand domain-containing protein [Tahibacter aquaticus]
MAKHYPLLGAVLVTLWSAVPAFAQQPASPPLDKSHAPVPPYSQIDSDGDGKLDKKEFAAATTQLNITLAQLDTNNDGNVSRGEWDDYRDGVEKSRMH